MKDICPHSFYNADIYPTGDVMPCCVRYCKEYSFGNIFEQSLDAIWNGERATAFRQKILSGDYSNCDLKVCTFPHRMQKKEILGKYYENNTLKLPSRITLCYDYECNVACRICRDKLYRNSKHDEERNEKFCENFLPYLNNCEILYSSGGGDPFGSRHMRHVIKESAKRFPHLKFDFITNGVLASEGMFKALGVMGRAYGVYVSLHAATEKTYNEIVKFGNYNKVMRNLQWISQEKKKGNIHYFLLKSVVTLLNFKEMPDFVKLAESLGAGVRFTCYAAASSAMAADWHTYAVFEKNHPSYVEFLYILSDPCFDSPSVELDPVLAEARKRATSARICPMPFYYAEINHSGVVTPCCPAYCKKYSFGNVNVNSLDEIWNSKEANEFRNKIINGNYECCDLSVCIMQGRISFRDVYERYYTKGVLNLPKTIVMSFDTECNVACVTCRHELYRNSDTEKSVLHNIASNMLPFLQHCNMFYASGSGDPFGSRFARGLIKEVASKYPHIKFDIITNGVLATPGMVRALGLEGRIRKLNISLHAALEGTYNKIVKYGNFSKVLCNLQRISELDETMRPAIQLCFVVHDENYKEMPAFVELAQRFGANANFTQYRNLHREPFSKNYATHTVFDSQHALYDDFLEVLRHPNLQLPICCFDGGLKKLQERALGRACISTEAAEKGVDIFDGLELRPYQRTLLERFHSRHSFAGKRVLEIGSDVKLQTAQAIARLGACEVVAVNPALAEDVSPPHPAIKPMKVLGEHTRFAEGYFDVIFGIALLEHVNNPRQLADECKRLLHVDGVCYLQGNPVWTSYHGHHVYLENVQPGNVSYLFSTNTVPLEHWEHLCLDTPEKVECVLKSKGVPTEHISELCHHLLEHPHISRFTPSEILKFFADTPDMNVQLERQYSTQVENEWFEKAANVYSKEDLRTVGIEVELRHTQAAKSVENLPLVSLGPGALTAWYCDRAGVRSLSNAGENTLPFDFAAMSMETVIHLLKHDFATYATSLHFDAANGFWRNEEHSILFNHDNDCGKSDVDMLAARLEKRASNFRAMVSRDDIVTFVLHGYFLDAAEKTVMALCRALRGVRKGKPFELIIWSEDRSLERIDSCIRVLAVPYPYDSPQDWWKPEVVKSATGQRFMADIKKGMTQILQRILQEGERARLRYELATLKGEVNALRESKSWKITAPLRWLQDKLMRRS